ncbi:MAG: methyltransferase family protein [Thermoanaerobaculia bacterium]
MFRWIALAAVVGTLGVSVYHRRRAREGGEVLDRRLETPGMKLLRGAVGLPLYGGLLVYLVRPRWMAWAAFDVPDGLRWAGAALGLAAVPGAWWVLRHLGRNVSETVLTKSDHALVTTGPYRWVRHPLYTTGFLLFLGVGLMAGSWFLLLFTLLAGVAIRFAVVPAEEEALVERFGDAYRRYMAGTGRLLPRLR